MFSTNLIKVLCKIPNDGDVFYTVIVSLLTFFAILKYAFHMCFVRIVSHLHCFSVFQVLHSRRALLDGTTFQMPSDAHVVFAVPSS